MKKTDTCYYMSITKEENSAFVVANHQSGIGGDPNQIVIDSKTEGAAIGSSSIVGTAATTVTSMTTPTTMFTANIAGHGGNGTSTSSSPIGHGHHQRLTENCCNATCDTIRGQEATGDSRGKVRNISINVPRSPMPPPVILQVLPSTPTLQHHNLFASDVHRECCMSLSFSSSALFFFISYILLLFSLHSSFYFSSMRRPIERSRQFTSMRISH